MNSFIKSLERDDVTNFSRNSYEVIFSVFMIAVAYLYRNNPLIVYPRILYYFVLLLGSNFLFSSLLRRRAAVNIWFLDLILLSNLWIITGILYYSGRGESYFWVLYLLPVFGASLMASFKDAFGVVFLCVLAIGVLSWPINTENVGVMFSLAAKVSVLAFSAGVVYRTSQAKKRAEATLASKRGEIEVMTREISAKEGELVKTASIGEVGELVSGVMHDLSSAVSVILLSAQVAAEDETPEKADLDRIIKAAEFSKTVIGKVLDLARGQEYVFEQLRLREPADNAILLLQYSAQTKLITFELDFPDTLPALWLSRVHMERFFLNALSNAISFTPQRGKIRIAARAAKAGAELTITDGGPGFPEELLRNGVKAFATTRKETGGTGLGLFVCSQVVQRHGGTLKLDNNPDGGARLTAEFPYTEVAL